LSSVTVCLGCGAFKTGGRWFECDECGYTPPDDESLTKQSLARDESVTSKLVEISQKVKNKQPVEFAETSMNSNWISKERLTWLMQQQEAMEQRLCPDCGAPIAYFEEGLSCGWSCSKCKWGVATTNPVAFQALVDKRASEE
jgi:NMD protein affecting ribosome stability and mRNA decay